MAVHSSMLETVEFDDPALANLLFGPHNAHLELLAAASGASIGSRGASILIESPDLNVRQLLCNVFVQLYELLRGGTSLSQQDVSRSYDMLRADPGLNLEKIFKDAVFVNTPRKTVTARNVAQRTYLDLLRRNELTRAQFYIRRLNNSELANAESLWLGIKVERALGDSVAMRQLAGQLRKRFPDSRELGAYERGAFNE